MLLPGATGGPSGGLSPNAVLPPAPHVVNPLDQIHAGDGRDAAEPARRANGRRGGVATTARDSARSADHQDERRRAARGVELGVAERPQ